MTFDHLSCSARIHFAKSEGELATTSNPCLPSKSRTCAARIDLIVSPLSLVTTSGGVAVLQAGDRKPLILAVLHAREHCRDEGEHLIYVARQHVGRRGRESAVG